MSSWILSIMWEQGELFLFPTAAHLGLCQRQARCSKECPGEPGRGGGARSEEESPEGRSSLLGIDQPRGGEAGPVGNPASQVQFGEGTGRSVGQAERGLVTHRCRGSLHWVSGRDSVLVPAVPAPYVNTEWDWA